MIVWFKQLPKIHLNDSEWKPFISNSWFRLHFMKVVYLLTALFIVAPYVLINEFFIYLNGVPVLLLLLFIFVIHEALHVLVIKGKGDISLTFKGIYFWLNTNAVLSKTRFFIFMSLPLFVLSVVPAVGSLFFEGEMKALLLIISWLNLIISASDVLNSFLILIKSRQSVFCRGHYRVVPT